MTADHSSVTDDPWGDLKRLTAARIALGRAGGSLPTSEWLAFKLAHARARDAVHCRFDAKRIEQAFEKFGTENVTVDSMAADRMSYLQRPDLGRRLSEASQAIIRRRSGAFDLVIIVSDGLSAAAAHEQVPPLAALLLPRLQADRWKLAPVVIARFGRVALEDEIGSLIGADIALMLIGERPGLGSPDSLGAYLVYGPKPGNSDADRNCVSNIRPEGLDYQQAADAVLFLLNESRRRKISGIDLKDERRTLLGNAAAAANLGSPKRGG
jgi:ethanolamine ammonia-lyase small subunit